MSLTDTQRVILTAAVQHREALAFPPERLPAGARQKVAQAMLRQNLVATVHRPADDANALWMVDGNSVLLQATDEGLRAIGVQPNGEEDEQSAAAIERRNAGRRAAEASMGLEAATESAEAGGAVDGQQATPEAQPPHDAQQAPAEALRQRAAPQP